MSTQNLNKKKTVIISIATVALTACITAAAILLTSSSSAEEIETTTEAETISETETYTIKPIPHTTKKQEEPKEITELTQETEIQEPETVTFAPEPDPKTESIIANEADAALLEEYGEYISGEPNYITGEEIIETLSSEDPKTTEAPATTAATTTETPEDIDWGGIVDDGFVDGGNETGHKPGDGGIGEIGERQPELGGLIAA